MSDFYGCRFCGSMRSALKPAVPSGLQCIDTKGCMARERRNKKDAAADVRTPAAAKD